MRVVFGTRNRGKVAELSLLLEPYGVEVLSLHDFPDVPDVVEDRETFTDNALKKARHMVDQLGLLGLADDSGLVVDALGGRPGVHSARYGGAGMSAADKNQRLLSELADVADERRTARFVCVLAAVPLDGSLPRVAEGICEGRILRAPQGEGGFGYDPVFAVDERPGRAMAELEPHDKNRVSHRGRAMRALLPDLLELLGLDPTA